MSGADKKKRELNTFSRYFSLVLKHLMGSRDVGVSNLERCNQLGIYGWFYCSYLLKHIFDNTSKENSTHYGNLKMLGFTVHSYLY